MLYPYASKQSNCSGNWDFSLRVLVSILRSMSVKSEQKTSTANFSEKFQEAFFLNKTYFVKNAV